MQGWSCVEKKQCARFGAIFVRHPFFDPCRVDKINVILNQVTFKCYIPIYIKKTKALNLKGQKYILFYQSHFRRKNNTAFEEIMMGYKFPEKKKKSRKKESQVIQSQPSQPNILAIRTKLTFDGRFDCLMEMGIYVQVTSSCFRSFVCLRNPFKLRFWYQLSETVTTYEVRTEIQIKSFA